jgi:two-component system, cell cycle response regulator
MDSLTGAWNRRHFMAAATQEMERAARYGSPLSAIMLDVDFFKAVNDGHGHGLGDEVLRRVVETCRAALREVDLFGRLGGEEFAVLLPETALGGALGLAERLRHAVAGMETSGIMVTLSLGVAQRQEGETSVDRLLGRADQALYRAKQNGRNRVEHASQG